MPIEIILAAAAVAASLPLLWWAVASDRAPARVDPRVLSGGNPPVADLRAANLQRGATERTVVPLLGALAQLGRRLTPVGRLEALDHRLVLAGRPPAWPLERVLAGKVVLGVSGAGLGLWWFTTAPSTGRLLGAAALTLLAYFAPDLLIISRAQERTAAIGKALPDAFDQMTIAVEAGLGFETAMARSARAGDGPLAEELVRTLQEVQLGVPRNRAMRNLTERTDNADLRHFALAVIQAEGYGIPVAQVLRTQAAEQRVKRRQRAEEQAMKIPVKIIFPLILCILPTLFIVILGPAAIQISRQLFGPGGAL